MDVAKYLQSAADHEDAAAKIQNDVLAVLLRPVFGGPPLTPAQVTKLKKMVEKLEAELRQAADRRKLVADEYKSNGASHEAGVEYRHARGEMMTVAQLNIGSNELVEAAKYMQKAYDLALDEELAFSQAYVSDSHSQDRYDSDAAKAERKSIYDKYGPSGTEQTFPLR